MTLNQEVENLQIYIKPSGFQYVKNA